MFTIKHISNEGGETLYEADDVTFHPYDDHRSESDAHVYITAPSSSQTAKLQPLYGGTVYVMNRFGATVAKYELGFPPIIANTAFGAQQKAAGSFGNVAGSVGRAA